MEPFPVVLEGAGTFRPVSQVVFVPIVEGEQHVRAAEAAVRRGPLDRTLSFPYHPHVTVAHDLEEDWLDQAHEGLQAYRAAFEVDRLSLFIQGADAVWRPVGEFPFGQSIIDPQRYMGDSVSIGLLDPVEFPALCPRLGEIVADAVASGAGVNFMLPFTAQDGEAWWRAQAEDVASGRRILLVARDEGEVVGTISLNPAVAPNQPHRAELSKLLVHSADRRRGVATRLMDAAAAEARERGFTLLTLDCVAGGPEEEFYRGLGYVALGTIPGYALSPTGEPQGATILYLELR
jgi:GNAT superfamily N-acetyltransferase